MANNADVEAVDFEPEDDDLMDEGEVEAASPRAPQPKLKSAVIGGGEGGSSSFSAPKKTKGRGFRDERTEAERTNRFASKDFDSLDSDGGPGAQRCKNLDFMALLMLSGMFVLFQLLICLFACR